MLDTCASKTEHREWIKWIRKNVKKNVFLFQLFSSTAADAALQTIKICIIERALEYFTLPFRIRLHTWLACNVLFVMYRRSSSRSLYLCWSNVCVCAHTHNSYNHHRCFAAAAAAAVDSFFNEICMAFCILYCVWCYLDKTVNKRCCIENSSVLVACLIIPSFVHLFIRYLMVVLAYLHAHLTKAMFVLRLID